MHDMHGDVKRRQSDGWQHQNWQEVPWSKVTRPLGGCSKSPLAGAGAYCSGSLQYIWQRFWCSEKLCGAR